MGRKIIILLGHPGAGKGTQAKQIMRRLDIPQISTGDMLRDAIARETSYGKDAKQRMDAGQYVQDEVVNGIVAERILREDCRNGFILDGYPRNVQQARTFQELMKPGDQIFVIEIAANPAGDIRRLVGRLMCTKCNEIYNIFSNPPARGGECDRCGGSLSRRPDDRQDVIADRFRTYREKTLPLAEYYKEMGSYHETDGMRPIADVTREILAVVDGQEVTTPQGEKGTIA